MSDIEKELRKSCARIFKNAYGFLELLHKYPVSSETIEDFSMIIKGLLDICWFEEPFLKNLCKMFPPTPSILNKETKE